MASQSVEPKGHSTDTVNVGVPAQAIMLIGVGRSAFVLHVESRK